jgi:hypothetical protein
MVSTPRPVRPLTQPGSPEAALTQPVQQNTQSSAQPAWLQGMMQGAQAPQAQQSQQPLAQPAAQQSSVVNRGVQYGRPSTAPQPGMDWVFNGSGWSQAPIQAQSPGGGQYAGGQGQGVTNSAQDPMIQGLLQNAVNGPNQTPWSSQVTDQYGNVITSSSGVKLSPSISQENVIQAALADRSANIGMVQQQNANEQQGIQGVGGALGAVTSGIQGRADALPGQMNDMLNQSLVPGQAQAAPIQQAAQANLGRTQAGVAGASADLLAREAMTLGNFKNLTAASIQQSREGITSQTAQAKQQIMAQAQQMGLPVNDPRIQAQLHQADQQAVQQLGSVAVQASLKYNDAVTQLQQSYDAMSQQNQQFGINAVGQAGQAQIGAETSAAQIAARAGEVLTNYRSASLAAQQQLYSVADQYAMAGASQIAEMLRDQTLADSPIAPIIAMAYSMQNSSSMMSPSAVVSGINALPGPMTLQSNQNMSGAAAQQRSNAFSAPALSSNTMGSTGMDPSSNRPASMQDFMNSR